MKSIEIVRGWKDEDYRLSLSNAEQALLPDHPAGLIELTDADLNGVDGGSDEWSFAIRCRPSHITFCMLTIDFAPCSFFGGCVTQSPVYCFPI